MILYIYWDPNPELFTLPIVHIPIVWYGVLFAAGFAVGFPIFVSILTRYLSDLTEYRHLDPKAIRKIAVQYSDKLTLYLVIGTVLGARLGHFLFYEKPSEYLQDPGQLLRVWEGGLASHGGALGIILAAFFFTLRYQLISWLRLLDFLSIPAALAAFFIRLGNFFNQEILGTPSDLPWAVLFAHPADRSLPVPRHPAQLYEGFFYLLVFVFLYRLSYTSFFKAKGKLFGLFLLLVFGFRFCIEWLKLEQSHLLTAASVLTMGQILSLPAIIAGFFFLLWKPSR